MSSIDARLAELGITLPTPATPAANYVPFVRVGDLLHVSGQIPVGPKGIEFVGKLGADADVDFGRAAARLCAINLLAQVKAATGDLEKLVRVVKLTGFVNSTLDFVDHPKVVNGASDLMVDALGDRGRHARSAVGVPVLPLDAPVEVEIVVRVRS